MQKILFTLKLMETMNENVWFDRHSLRWACTIGTGLQTNLNVKIVARAIDLSYFCCHH